MPVVPEPSDEALFEAYRAGDVSAFETLFQRYRLSLGRHLTRILDDPAAAEDLVVETFLRLHRHRDRWRPGMPLRPWTFAIARNLARNRLRSPLSQADDPGETPPAARDEVRRRVAAAFAELPAAQRESCSLRLLGGLTLEEIARITGASAGTVKSRLFYGLRRLRVLLADLSPEK